MQTFSIFPINKIWGLLYEKDKYNNHHIIIYIIDWCVSNNRNNFI